MGARLLTGAYAVFLGAWVYLEQKQIDLYSQGTYDFLHALPVQLALVALPVLVGFFVGRWWAIASLAGPLFALSYLQIVGYVSPWHDGWSPLSLPTVVGMLFFALLLLLGVGLRSFWNRRHTGRPAPTGG